MYIVKIYYTKKEQKCNIRTKNIIIQSKSHLGLIQTNIDKYCNYIKNMR